MNPFNILQDNSHPTTYLEYQPQHRPLLHWPNQLLSVSCQPVHPTQFSTASLTHLIDDMFFTMYHSSGIGLAANQIGTPLRIAVLHIHDPSTGYDSGPLTLINPKIDAATSPIDRPYHIPEGCLSLPGHTAKVKRLRSITISAQDVSGKSFSMDCEGILSIAVQHEIDHLNGLMYFHRLSALKRELLLTSYRQRRKPD
jgi:peptide deformylase